MITQRYFLLSADLESGWYLSRSLAGSELNLYETKTLTNDGSLIIKCDDGGMLDIDLV